MNRTPPDFASFLHSVVPFSMLEPAEVERLAGRLEVRYYIAGETVAQFRPPGEDGLFIVRKGAVELIDGAEQRLETRGEAEMFGHRIRFGNAVCDYCVRAIEDCLIWHLPPGEAAAMRRRHPALAAFLAAGPGGRLRDAVRAHGPGETLRDLPLRPPITATGDETIRACAERMARGQVSCLPIVDGQRLIGIVTDRDLRNRVLATGQDPEGPISSVMTPKPATVALDDPVDAALVEMMRLGIHHLPILEPSGRLAAVASAGDLVRLQSPDPLRLVRDLQRAETPEAVARLAHRGPALLAGLVRGGFGASGTGRIAGRITDACTRRLLALAEEELGPPPMNYAWLAFGSQARLEQGLISDQDNGLLLAEDPDEHASGYFRDLAERVCVGLDACGYVFCPGGVMARGEWRLSLTGWRDRFRAWIDEPEPQSVMHTSIFFDLRAVAGDAGLAIRLHRDVLARAREREIFRRFLAAESISHRPPIGLFRQFVQEHSTRPGHEHDRGLDLKKRGVIPIVDLARVRALEGGLEAVHTEERLQAAAGAGGMTEADADDLIHAFRFISDIRLRHQVGQIESGERPDHLVDPDELSGLHRRYLRSAFGIVDAAQKALAQRYLV